MGSDRKQSSPRRSGPGVQMYLATAALTRAAEREHLRRGRGAELPESPLAAEYRSWLEDNQATHIVLAIRMESNRGFADEQEVRRMEQESVMRASPPQNQNVRRILSPMTAIPTCVWLFREKWICRIRRWPSISTCPEFQAPTEEPNSG